MKARSKGIFDSRYASLDHWRGVAALSVMVFHAFGQVRGAGLSVHPSIMWLKWLSDYGGFGVDIFFVISGFCIAANLYRCAQSNRGAMDFLRDRVLRIYPMYWAACVAAIAMNVVASPFNQVPIEAGLPADLKTAIANVLLLEPYFGNVPPLLLVSWSLVFEIGFYILAALGFALWRFGANVWLLLGLGFVLGLVGVLHANDNILYVLKLWPEFAFGAAVFVSLWLRERRPTAAWLALPPLLIFVIIDLFAYPKGWPTPLLVAAGFALLLHVLHPWDALIAKARPLCFFGWVGTFSYSLYLTHAPLGLRIIPLGRRWVEHDSPWMWLLQVLGWGGSIAVAWLFYRFFEARLERWRRGLNKSPKPSKSPPFTSKMRGISE